MRCVPNECIINVLKTYITVKNSIKFGNKVNNTELKQGGILVQFEACSLFPNVPIPETLAYACIANFMSHFEIDF